MLTARDLSHGLFGAWRLARLDRGAMAYFDATIDGFWKSFWAAAIVAPAFVVMTAFSLSQANLPERFGFVEIALVEASRYVIAWVAFPLLMTTVADLLQRGERYVGFIVAYNWAQVVEMAVVLPVFLFVVASGLPASEPNAYYTVLFFAITLYYWFIARTALQISGWAAGAVVILNLTLSGGIEYVSSSLLR
jgi:hypothetical protein